MSTKTIVAIHGIGDQTEYATVQSVVGQLCGYHKVGMPVPLGRFHSSATSPIIQMSAPPDPSQMDGLAFAEVYWAGIPRQVAQQGFQLEEIKGWGRTITNRLAQRAEAAKRPMPRREQRRLVTVVDEMVETVRILERVGFVTSKAGLFTFSLAGLMRDFVGDVQIVADFPARRDDILLAFDKVMTKAMTLGKPAGDVELYLVAHSEGSVVTFLALLRALAEPEKHPWIKAVKGLMTVGAPIETHHLFWPELWQDLKPSSKASVVIPWKNYLDSGDPIAFPLTRTHEWLDTSGFAKHFQLEEMAFSRSLLPGKAHTDYWNDDQVFGHFIDHVIFEGKPPNRPQPTPPPRSSWLAPVVSYAIPHLLVVALLFFATYLLYRPVLNAISDPPGRLSIFRDVLGISLLLIGVTAASRIPRLTRQWRWWSAGAMALALSMVAYEWIATPATQDAIGGRFTHWQWWIQIRDAQTTGVLFTAALIALIGAFLASWFPRYGVRLLPALGLSCAAVLVIELLSTADERVEAWPIVVGGALFFYLWWLAALIFDLVFVWHRFVRHAVATDTVADLTRHGYRATLLERAPELRRRVFANGPH